MCCRRWCIRRGLQVLLGGTGVSVLVHLGVALLMLLLLLLVWLLHRWLRWGGRSIGRRHLRVLLLLVLLLLLLVQLLLQLLLVVVLLVLLHGPSGTTKRAKRRRVSRGRCWAGASPPPRHLRHSAARTAASSI